MECRTQAKGFFGKYSDLRRQFRTIGHDAGAVLVTFPGHYLMPLAWLLTRKPRKTLIFDAFISLSDTLVDDRGKVSWWHPYAWFLYVVDWVSCHLANEVLIDTEAHRQFFIRRFHLRPERIRAVDVGTREDLFRPDDVVARQRRGAADFHVLFYGTYIPLHGIEYILQAAAIIEKKQMNARFTLIGGGQTYKQMRALAEKLALKNITFIPMVPFTDLPGMIRESDLCLGIFGTSGKTQRVIPHKVYDAVACGVPILTARTPAILEKFSNDPRVLLCNAGDAENLAANIEKLAGVKFSDSHV